MAAFVLGNGRSREPLDVNHLLTLAPVYGCNALYRSHCPTVLVATDRPIATQIQESGYPRRNRFYTRRPMPNLGALPVPKKYFGFSSGPIACAIAAVDGMNPIYLVGFDMGPTEVGRFNNVYADTEFYKKTEALPTFTGNWVRQILTVVRDHPRQRFIRVHGTTTSDIAEFDGVANLEKLHFDHFMVRINTPKDL